MSHPPAHYPWDTRPLPLAIPVLKQRIDFPDTETRAHAAQA